jgi:uracil-DNA glycosylase
LNMCWPGQGFDEQMRRTWITESVLCSAKKEGGHVPVRVGKECRRNYLERQLALFPSAVVAALGSKAANRLAGLDVVICGAAAPPASVRQDIRESWNAIARELRKRVV